MLVVLLTWIYYGIILFLIGLGVTKLINHFWNKKDTPEIISCIIAGVIAATVYAQIFSLFYKVSFLAHFIVVLTALGIGLRFKKEVKQYSGKLWTFCRKWDVAYLLVIILIIAFYTSRGDFHTDTMIYHANAIQWLEEYGIVPGLANLQQHFGYNSSYFAFAALFSLKFLTGVSLHTTTGFLMCVFCLWSCGKVKEFGKNKRYVTPLCAVGILFYTFVNINGSMSPASDYITNLFALYIIARWAELWEYKEKDVHKYALLCLVCVYLLTLKVSGGLLVIITLYPAVLLIKEKQWKAIGLYIGTGIVILVPFLIRNVIISGWLIYPFAGIDLFSVDWKVPLEYLESDSIQISVWGKCLFDVGLADMPISQWVPIWWEAQERYHKMMIGGNVLAVVILCGIIVRDIFYKHKIEWQYWTLILGTMASMVLWFVMAPFVRYGLAFLIAFPAITLGEALRREHNKEGLFKVGFFYLSLCMFVCFVPMVEHYVNDAGVFAKQRLLEPYYIFQKEYEVAELRAFEVDGVTYYEPVKGDQLGYAPIPSTAYDGMMMRSKMRGTTIKEGYAPGTVGE